MSHSVQRLGRNKGGYLGETIDIHQVLRDDLEAARRFGWQIEEIPVSGNLDLLAFRRVVQAPSKKLYISGGIHGDEPAGPLAVRQLLRENEWPDHANICTSGRGQLVNPKLRRFTFRDKPIPEPASAFWLRHGASSDKRSLRAHTHSQETVWGKATSSMFGRNCWLTSHRSDGRISSSPANTDGRKPPSELRSFRPVPDLTP